MAESKQHSGTHRRNQDLNSENAPNSDEHGFQGDYVRPYPGVRRGSDRNVRREDNPISFRQFLQNHENAPSYPDLYRCSLQDRLAEENNAQSNSPDLPDFVQDHLAVEHLYFNNQSQTSAVNLPDFASFIPRNGDCESSFNESSRPSCVNRVPLDLPGHSLPFDLTTRTNNSENLTSSENSAGMGGRLPDFLSDGPILGLNDTSPGNPRAHENMSSQNSELNLREENSRLREELNILQGILMKKDDRIKELEDIVMALEISKMQMSIDANTQTSVKSAAVGKFASSSNTQQSESVHNTEFVDKVKLMTNSSEKLAKDLLKVLTDFQTDVDNYVSNGSKPPCSS